jgi:gamma-glutamylcyclotransferase (GGCT)/AIG2-like uncharacterized protein YtfP
MHPQQLKNYRAVYGTLRSGFGIHEAYGMNDSTVCQMVWQGWLDGFQMWRKGIPFAKRGPGRIWVEVYRFEDRDTLVKIDALELGAGYRLIPIDIPTCPDLSAQHEPCYLYEYLGSTDHFDLVPDGVYT